MKNKVFIITIMLLVCCTTIMAQQARIAFFSYKTVLTSLPQYVNMKQALEENAKQYASELQSSEQDFSDRYEMFVEQQQTLAPSIKTKRQSELQNLYDRNVKFRQDSEKELKQKEQDALAPIKEKIAEAISKVGSQGGYLMVVNTDSEACPYIDPTNSTDVTQEIITLASETK